MNQRLGAGLLARARKRISQAVSPFLPGPRRSGGDFNWLQELQRAGWRKKLRDSGEVERLEALRGIHAGQRCFILGNGPSLKQQDLTRLAGEITFVTNWFANHPDYDRIRPTYYCISSHEVFGGWNAKTPRLDATMRSTIVEREWRSHHFFPLIAREPILRDSAFDRNAVHFLAFEKPKANVVDRGTMNWDVTSNLDDGFTGIVTFAIPLAVHMGIREIYLLGCDCDYQIQSASDPKAYFYDFKKHTTATSHFDTLARVWGPEGQIFQVYEIVRREAAERDVQIFNATAGGKLEVFPRRALNEVLT